MQTSLFANRKPLLKEIKDQYKWGDILGSETIRCDVFKRSTLPRLTYKFKAIPVRIPAAFLAEIDKLIPKFIWNPKGSRRANNVKEDNE